MDVNAEDGDDKTRRNLVVASGSLITAWIAGVPVPVLMERLVGKDVSLSYWRVFLAALAVLTYMILRFRFAPDTRAAIEVLRADWNSRCWERADKAINRALDRYTKSGIEARLFDGKLEELVANASAGMLETTTHVDGSKPVLGRPSMTAGLVRNGGMGVDLSTAFEGRAGVGFSWETRNQRLTSSGNRNLVYKFSGAYRRWLKVRIFAALAVYSESSLKVFVPITLAAIALVGLVVQLIMSIPHDSSPKLNAPVAVLAKPAASLPHVLPASAGTTPSAPASR